MGLRFEAALKSRNFEVALELAPGETLAVLGPNGAGKSTLLSIIAGLLRPDSGSATIGERTLFDLASSRSTWVAPHDRGTALLAQEPLLFPHLSVLENVAFGPRSTGTPAAEARSVARQWLASTDTGALESRRPGELSGGQAQRVAVARALAAGPDLLLLDEPMAALDIHAAPLMRRLLKHVLAGRSAIIITHDVLDALMLAERVIVMEDGRITEAGATREVLNRPRSRFAAGLSGLNLLTGTARTEGIDTRYGLVSGTPEGTVSPGVPAAAAFHPSAVSVYLDPPHGSPRNMLRATITDLEPHGDAIRVRAGDLAADITPAALADLGLAPGMRAFFVLKATAVTIYST
ncbi:sulfate/molybdate ABC transporter ATP-binding protein [Paeniglutamicibacter psychrophenolicus]|uniref:sulfate/molybdate ABC transporter ATP-binding protein n=1 Tax=Paeniglutamicibacter psychrophenolicus TaxID=257454 RepID=UPI002786CEA6|nr:ABC transporter ATP-binding protein [Paeniglutamicibacter psychrophenolicus]MDQ0092961.1 molybdate transport system ATP-binding protein [Paeniglutamicibacter psychrophenolicus]